MTEINEKTYINNENIVIAQEVNGKYLLTLSSGAIIAVTKDIYDEVKSYEGGGGGGGTTYTAGEGIDITNDVISNTQDPVEANPTLAGGESDLTSIQVGDVKYAIPHGTNVVANPDVSGETPTELVTLEIGGVKYQLPIPTDVIANPTLAGTEAELGSIQIGETKFISKATKTILASGLFHEGDEYVEFDCENITDYDIVIFTFNNLFFVWFMASSYLDSSFLQSMPQHYFGSLYSCQLAKTSHDGITYRIRPFNYATTLEDDPILAQQTTFPSYGGYGIVGIKL